MANLAPHPLRFLIVLCVLIRLSPATAAEQAPLHHQSQTLMVKGKQQNVRIPLGYRLELLASGMDRPRMLTFAPNGDLFIGSASGRIYRLAPPYRAVQTWGKPGGYPHSVAFRDGQILIARTDGLYSAPYPARQHKLDGARLRLLAALPAGGGHSSRTVAVGPDKRVYLSLGIRGNCDNEYLDASYPFSRRRGGILVLVEQGSRRTWQIYASGLRNPVGFDWHPASQVMYASNNGPDHRGFEQPPEYFSRVLPGSFHGMPWFQFDGHKLVRDRCIGATPPRPLAEVSIPVATFAARNAPMGVVFVPRGAMEPRLEHDAIVALHGSWATGPGGGFFGAKASRRPPKIVVVRFLRGRALRVETLISGFQRANGERWARPVGVAIGADGWLYFSSDHEGGLYRLKKVPTTRPATRSVK